MLIYLDGRIVPEEEAKISVLDHGLLYGDGVFEGIRAYDGRLFRIQEHLDRLDQSARSIMMRIPWSQEEITEAIVETVRIALEQTPPELAADIVDKGIVLTGGGSLLKNIDILLREETRLPITITEDPLSTVVIGTGKALDNLEVLREITIR